MSNDTNKREREKREARLKALGLRPVGDGPRCLFCQIPLGPKCFNLLCVACDRD
jgi:hypothetical protein